MPTTQGFSDARILARWSLLGISTRHSQARGDAAPTTGDRAHDLVERIVASTRISTVRSPSPSHDVRAEPGGRRLRGRRDPAEQRLRAVARRGRYLPEPPPSTTLSEDAGGSRSAPRRASAAVSDCRRGQDGAMDTSVAPAGGWQVNRRGHIRLHVPVATPKSVRPAKTVALNAMYPAITDIETAVPRTHDSSRRPSPLASRAFIRPSELY